MSSSSIGNTKLSTSRQYVPEVKTCESSINRRPLTGLLQDLLNMFYRPTICRRFSIEETLLKSSADLKPSQKQNTFQDILDKEHFLGLLKKQLLR